jgi:hypothetical protein
MAVEENDGLAFAHVQVAHVGVEDCHALSWMRIEGCHV